jgi:hypothetical protein
MEKFSFVEGRPRIIKGERNKAPDANREASGMSKNSKRERKKSWKEIDNQIVKCTKGINK